MNEAPTTTDYAALARQYTAVVVPGEDDPFVARAVDFPGAMGAGATRDEAAAALAEGIAAMLEHAHVRGLAVPEPMRNYTGALSVRLPKSLHVALAQRADAEGLSLNATVTYLLTRSLELQDVVPARKRRAPRSKQPG